MAIASTPGPFIAAMHSLEGRVCWATFYGPSTGSIIQFLFEPKLPRAEPLKNPALTDEERHFDGECVLFVSCSWQLHQHQQIRFRSDDAYSDPVRLGKELDRLVGQRLRSAEVREPNWDAVLEFADDCRLLLMSDQVDERDNYDVSTRAHVYTVGPEGRLRVEPREFD